MPDLKFREISAGVYRLDTPLGRIASAVYLVRGDATLLIDSGSSAEVGATCVVPALRHCGVAPGRIDWLLATHTHGDHIGGHAFLKEQYGIPVAVAAIGKERLADPLTLAREIRALFPTDSPPPLAGLRGVRADRLLCDRESIGPLEMIASPGHDADAVSFLHRPTGLLLTGDAVQWNGTATQGCGFYRDLPAYRATLTRLNALPIKGIAPSHVFYPYPDQDVLPPETLEEALAITRFYDTFINGMRGVPPHEMCDRLFRALVMEPPEFRFLALFTINEHLKSCNHPIG